MSASIDPTRGRTIIHFLREFNQNRGDLEVYILQKRLTASYVLIYKELSDCPADVRRADGSQATPKGIKIQEGQPMNKKPLLYQGNTDKRILEKKILAGELPEDTLREYLSSLPDVSSNAEEISVTLEEKK